MNKWNWLVSALVVFLFLFALTISCANDDSDDDDGYNCAQWVDDPLEDCESICTEQTCSVAIGCKDYVDVGNMDDCIANCFEGCQAGCIPVGIDACMDSTSDCETLIDCLKPLFL